jgi:uncharacterized protein YhfF
MNSNRHKLKAITPFDMQTEPTSINAVWQRYLDSLPSGHLHRSLKPDAFAFGGEGPLGDELGALVLSGKKRATTSLPIEFTSLGEALPKVGDVSIILNGKLQPIAIIERTDVKTVPFNLVDNDYAMIEGEGDGSLQYWRESHIDYFGSIRDRFGVTFNENTPVICQQFKILWPLSEPPLA